jgi:hypothetical protein
MADAKEEDRIRQELENGGNNDTQQRSATEGKTSHSNEDAGVEVKAKDAQPLEDLPSPRNGKTPRPGGRDEDATGEDDKGKEKEEAKGAKATKTPTGNSSMANTNAARAYANSKSRANAYADKDDLRRYYTAIDRNLRDGTPGWGKPGGSLLLFLIQNGKIEKSKLLQDQLWPEQVVLDS